MKGFIIGKEEREYTPNGAQEKKTARTLHVAWDGRKDDEVKGHRVESVYCPFDLNGIEPGMYCEFEYEIRQTRNGAMARLVDVIPLGEAEILLVPPEVK